jgi:predicted  nucleic acid-binding Zn-ribbon protein
MEEQNSIIEAIRKLDEKFERRFDELHQSQIRLEGLRSDFQFFAEDLQYVKTRIDAWGLGDDDAPSLPTRVSALEMRVTRLEKKRRS